MDAQTKFINDIRPQAERVAKRLGVPAEFIIARWAGETGWGKRILPGTNNLGNVISLNGKGHFAYDNGNPRHFRVFDSLDAYADFDAGMLERKYKDALNTNDPNKHFAALKAGGYAESPRYVEHMGNMYKSVMKRVGGATNVSDPDVGNPIGKVVSAGVAAIPYTAPKLPKTTVPKQKAQPSIEEQNELTKEELQAITRPKTKTARVTALRSFGSMLDDSAFKGF